MTKEAFVRYDPATMNSDDYLGEELFRSKFYDLRVVSVLDGVFSPLLETLSDKVAPLLDDPFLESIIPSGGLPYRSVYDRHALNQGKLYPALKLKPFKDYVCSYQPSGKSSLAILSPIGEYGTDFATANVSAARTLYTIASDAIVEECREAGETYRNVIRQETFQKKPLDSIKEGIQTTCAVISVLMAEKVEGFEDPLQLARQLVEDDIVNFFAANSANAQVFPLVRDGFYFDFPVIKTDGTFSVRGEIEDAVIEERKKLLPITRLGVRGRGCPVARKTIFSEGENEDSEKESGVNLLARLYLDCLEFYVNRESPVIALDRTTYLKRTTIYT